MELVLWNERAVGTDFEIGAVVFLKKVHLARKCDPWRSMGFGNWDDENRMNLVNW